MSKKKQEQALDELTQESENLGLYAEFDVEYDSVTYCPAWNDQYKRFDLLKILVNTQTDQIEVVREATRFQHDYQIHAEILKKFNEDFVKKGKK